MRTRTYTQKQGFTIVELLIVIIVIGILAALILVAYSGVNDQARASVLKSDLTQAGKQLGIDRENSGGGSYPTSLAAANGGKGINASSGATFTYYAAAGSMPQYYCLQEATGSTTYYTAASGGAALAPASGNCFAGGWWPLNGNVTDASSNALSATNSGATLAAGQNGAANSAYSFTGSQYIQLPAGSDQPLPMTLSAWAYPTSFTSSGSEGPYIIAADPGPRIRISQTGNVQGTVSLTSGSWQATLSSTNAVPLNQWVHVAYVITTGNQYLYVNGALVASSTIGNSTINYTASTPLVIGADNYTTAPFHGYMYGSIDDVRVYGRALSGADVSALYAAGAQ